MSMSATSINKVSFKQTIINSRVLLLKITIHLMSFLPLITLYVLAFDDQLGADPVDEVIHFTGIGAFNLLLISLLVTPLAKKYRQGYLLQIRRLLGLYSFTYAVCHLLSFLAFEVQFNFSLFLDEILDRPYITIGMLAWAILCLLAVTSITTLKRKMGRNWQRLHNWVYVASLLIALHFLWSVKSDIVEPVIYGCIVIIFLVLRRDKIKRWFV